MRQVYPVAMNPDVRQGLFCLVVAAALALVAVPVSDQPNFSAETVCKLLAYVVAFIGLFWLGKGLLGRRE